jgi:hypothetical protein
MIVFVTSSIALIAWGFLQPDSKGIGWQNVALLMINLVGAYRYLIHDAHKRRKDRSAKPNGSNVQPNKAPAARA